MGGEDIAHRASKNAWLYPAQKTDDPVQIWADSNFVVCNSGLLPYDLNQGYDVEPWRSYLVPGSLNLKISLVSHPGPNCSVFWGTVVASRPGSSCKIFTKTRVVADNLIWRRKCSSWYMYCMARTQGLAGSAVWGILRTPMLWETWELAFPLPSMIFVMLVSNSFARAKRGHQLVVKHFTSSKSYDRDLAS